MGICASSHHDGTACTESTLSVDEAAKSDARRPQTHGAAQLSIQPEHPPGANANRNQPSTPTDAKVVLFEQRNQPALDIQKGPSRRTRRRRRWNSFSSGELTQRQAGRLQRYAAHIRDHTRRMRKKHTLQVAASKVKHRRPALGPLYAPVESMAPLREASKEHDSEYSTTGSGP